MHNTAIELALSWQALAALCAFFVTSLAWWILGSAMQGRYNPTAEMRLFLALIRGNTVATTLAVIVLIPGYGNAALSAVLSQIDGIDQLLWCIATNGIIVLFFVIRLATDVIAYPIETLK